MEHKSGLLKAVVVGSILLVQSCVQDHKIPPANQVVGYLYTTTNGEDINQVVKFSRHADGSLSDETAYTTNSKGGADVKAGGDAHGDFDAQGAVQLIGDYLLTTNAGGNQVSVFSLNKSNGDLTFKSNTSSGGTRPVSIAYTKKAGIADEYWVVVGNQWNNPNVQKDGAKIERYPNNAFFLQDLKQADASDNERTIQLFTFNAKTGVLTSEKQLDKYVRENGGPTTVSFSPDGTKLAVSTWGIAHFDTKVTSLAEQHPSRVYVYSFANGSISNRRYFEEAGISGTIGFNWAITGSTRLFVSNFNLIPTKLDNSVTVLDDNGSSVAKASNFAVTSSPAINEACWTVLNSTGDKLFVASFQTNLVSTFNAASSGLTLTKSEARSGLAPNGDSKELWISPDNKYVYNLGSFQSFSINLLENTGPGAVYKSQTILKTTAAGAGIAGKYNFLGLTGFNL
ncbi:beta-propeller fold lactonase family protein [Spirosoma luteum]|uniref:beta-propeller fold lactonase family protein n=1 Tax=Spirosoma luteum TaxID=431553 RepID=UPI000369F8AE|nr:beta-propeller fold lactonase family protein [Spirosoma luteum]